MADNQLNPEKPFALPDHAVIALQGIDAVAFAHAQFANDVTALAIGHWQWNCWLTPKGRVIALFALIKADENSLLLLLPDHPAESMAEQLRKFVFRKKAKIETSALHVSARFASPRHARGTQLHVDGETIELDFGTTDSPRTLLLSANAYEANEALTARWREFDLRHGVPHLDESQREQWTPQQLSLERLPAFSVKKGCYPGQEIVARTHFLGKAKRGLALLEGDAPFAGDGEVFANGASTGRIASVAGNVALAVLPLEREPALLFVDGQPVRELPLLPR